MTDQNCDARAAACGLTFAHDWHGFFDADGRTCVCDGELSRQGLK